MNETTKTLVTDFEGERVERKDNIEQYLFKFDNGYVVSVVNVDEPQWFETIFGRHPDRVNGGWELGLALQQPSEILGIPVDVTPFANDDFPAGQVDGSLGGYVVVQTNAEVNALLTKVSQYEAATVSA